MNSLDVTLIQVLFNMLMSGNGTTFILKKAELNKNKSKVQAKTSSTVKLPNTNPNTVSLALTKKLGLK